MEILRQIGTYKVPSIRNPSSVSRAYWLRSRDSWAESFRLAPLSGGKRCLELIRTTFILSLDGGQSADKEDVMTITISFTRTESIQQGCSNRSASGAGFAALIT